MLNNPTLETLRALKLHGMAAAFEEQLQNPSTASLSFEERYALLVDRERLHRENSRTSRLLRLARLKHSQASVEDINYRSDRKLDKRLIATLASGEWIRRGQGLLMTGKTGTGKSWLFCALARQACRQGRTVRYWRLARLLKQLRIAHADGSYIGLLKKIAKTDLIALDSCCDGSNVEHRSAMQFCRINDPRYSTLIFSTRVPSALLTAGRQRRGAHLVSAGKSAVRQIAIRRRASGLRGLA